jgi:hypothetical protein
MPETATRQARRTTDIVLREQLTKQPLATKVSLLHLLKESIAEDKKKLEEQLKLITN